MKPLYVLLAIFIIGLLMIRIVNHAFNYQLAACVAMSIMLLFTAIGHFKFIKGMAMIIPNFIPIKVAWVYFTGVIEIAAAIGLLTPSLRTTTS